jgi:7,8-dihydropterin-6-yl-methyl-4-(beta-D-ribofuranosyl)aminobenzene 5'-phosphate synthase
MQDITITVVHDNHPLKEVLDNKWGFSCLINGAEKTILFDTGPGGSLLRNMEKLAIEPHSIDAVVLSHIHPDHTGGLECFLEENPDVIVYLLESFPQRFKDAVQAQGAKIVEVEQPTKICENVWSSGELGKWMKEQSLIIRTDSGLIVIVGCSHPGIVNIVNAASDLIEVDILLVMGGFHLEGAGAGKIEKVISALKKLQVRYVGLCHGSGEKARSMFEEHFGPNYIDLGAGKVVSQADL